MGATTRIRPRTIRRGGEPPKNLDVEALEHDLRESVRGEVGFSDGDLGLYSTDASNYRQVPIGVVTPLDSEDVIQAVRVCREYGAPVLSRGGGTSLAGQCCNVAVVLDFSRHMNRILEIDPDKKTARVQPGVVLDTLRDEAEKHHLTFGPDPATHNRCTLGGMIGNNSCGVHSIMAGKTAENVEELEVLTYDGQRFTVGATPDADLVRIVGEGGRHGEIYSRMKRLVDRHANEIRARYPDIPRLVSGYNLNQLLPENGFNIARALVGTEGTCVTVLEATLRLVYSPPVRSLLVLGFPDVFDAADRVPEILTYGPTGLEGFDSRLLGQANRKGIQPKARDILPEGNGWLLVEFGGETRDEADGKARKLMDALGNEDNSPDMKLMDNPKEAQAAWTIRESGLGATARVPGEPPAWAGWEDSAVDPNRVGEYLRELRKLENKYGYNSSFYGHFGDGCIHTRIDFDLETSEGIAKFTSFLNEAADLVIKYGGSLSGEHGDGQARAALLPKMFGDDLVRAFEEFKSIWDPEWKMNPGKVVRADLPDQNLRLGTDYSPAQPRTHFKLPEDGGSLSRATLRCVGVGKCRRLGNGSDVHDSTMCPSYMATHEERHSTRGRARLLFEMLEGNPVSKGWRSDAVKDALDLCLACKGCKSDCPVNVDMATYKAEFLSHYYKGRLRPITAYSLGMIYWWARIASKVPELANLFTQTPGIRPLAKLAAGIDQHRSIPKFATQTFRDWFHERGERNTDAKRVILWADTFNNYFHPTTGRSTAEVLEAAGFHVTVPRQSLCCGRPLYDYGMLALAKYLLRQVLDTLRDDIRAGVPVVGMEPSCVAVFRDELTNLFPNDQDAIRLSKQFFMLSEFLERENVQLPKLQRRAVVHGHCHHKAIMKMGAEESTLERLGLDFEVLPSGCCGMAGAFGFERGEHYEVAMKAGELTLLPAVNRAAKDTLIVADGFSCREQIAQATNRRALHLSEVIHMAMQEPGAQDRNEYPEREYPNDVAGSATDFRKAGAIGLGTVVLGLGWRVLRNRR